MENLNTSFYQPTKFSQNEKGVEDYQTGKKETISYKSVFQLSLFDAERNYKTGAGKIKRKENSSRSLAHKLDEGEFAVVERKYSEMGIFNFTTRDNNKINSAADVAFIFRQLESEAVEHAFAVYIDKDLNPSVQWLSMGGISATIIDPKLMVDAAQRLKAKEIYLVHNHPSGNLIPSRQDLNMFEKLKNGFLPMGITLNAIIINIISGNYIQFDENGSSVLGEEFSSFDSEREKKISVFSFNKQAFLQSPTNSKIRSSSDVAQFLSQQKFSSGQKAGYLLLSTKNEIVGNFFATQNTRNKAYKEVAGLVSKFGASNVVAYTNKADIVFYNDLKADLNNLDIDLNDVIECESSAFVCQTFDKYKSLADVGLLNESRTYYQTNKDIIMKNSKKNKELQQDESSSLKTGNSNHIEGIDAYDVNSVKENQPVNSNNEGKENTYPKNDLEYLTNQIKYLGFGEGLQEILSQKIRELNETMEIPLTQSFFSPGNPLKNKEVDFTLHFNKGKESDRYFLNSYSAQLKGLPEENHLAQKFFINKGKGITAKEAFNLLSERAVNKDLTNKEGVTYNAWVKLKPVEVNGENRNRDFQIFSENYGFDLEKTLSKYPVKEMETPEGSDKLISSLKKGNLQAVTFTQNNEESTKFISANPQFKNLNVYNHDGSVMFHNQIVFNKNKDAQEQTTNTQPAISHEIKEKKPVEMKR